MSLVQPTATAGDVTGLAYEHLKQKILTGALPAGEPVTISQITSELQLSTAPVREAIRMLASEGLMELRPRRSPIVVGLSAAELDDTATIRLALEPFLLRLAFPNHTEKSLALCEAIIEQDRHTHKSEDKVSLNRDFHFALLTPANRPRSMNILAEQYETLNRFNQMFVLQLSDEDSNIALNSHSEILSALRIGEIDKAADQLFLHINSATDRIKRQLNLSGQA